MRILLIEPPFHAFMNYDRWYYPTSLAQLAAVAYAANHEVVIYDADKYFYKDPANKVRSVFLKKQHLYYDNVDNFNHEIWQHFRQVLEDFDPEVVAVSIYTSKLKSAINALKLVREFNPAIKTCVGGAHATAVPKTLVSEDYIDSVFLGHADLTFPEWLTNGCPKGIIQGDLSRINFEKLPYQRRQALLFPEYYTSRDLGIIFMSRGCVGQCTFCSNSFMWSGKPRFRTSASIIAELTELFEKWKIKKEIIIGDGSISDIPEESRRVARILKDFGIRWTACVRWATINRDLLEYFIDCGCYEIKVGLESGSDKVLRYMKKGCNKNLIREKARMINSLGIKWHLFCIGGFPVETVEDMKETTELALEIKPYSISFNSLSPLPGTEVYKNIPGMTPELASIVNQMHPVHCFSEHMNLESFQNMFMKIIAVFDDYNKIRDNS